MPVSQSHTNAIGKVLSANDVGATDSHQAGPLIPKDSIAVAFFPTLDPSEFNPSVELRFTWDEDGTEYVFRFVYYNGKLTGRSTRNEYRLTRMTGFLRDSGLGVGDTLVLYRLDGALYVSHRVPIGGVVPSDGSWAIVRVG